MRWPSALHDLELLLSLLPSGAYSTLEVKLSRDSRLVNHHAAPFEHRSRTHSVAVFLLKT
jgi:hypothetical protein